MTTNRSESSVTIPPCTRRMLRWTPLLFVFWKNGGRYPAFPTVKIPFDGPATHVSTLASTPNIRAIAITGPAHDMWKWLK